MELADEHPRMTFCRPPSPEPAMETSTFYIIKIAKTAMAKN
jgi:hypothetical protein